jgi:hypothetical protein
VIGVYILKSINVSTIYICTKSALLVFSRMRHKFGRAQSLPLLSLAEEKANPGPFLTSPLAPRGEFHP